MKKDKEGLQILKGLIEKGDLKLKVRLKVTKDDYIAIGTLTYQGKQVTMKMDKLSESDKKLENVNKKSVSTSDVRKLLHTNKN